MYLTQITCIFVTMSISFAVQYPTNPTSEMSADEKNLIKVNKTMEQSDESGHEVDTDGEEVKDKKYLVDAMRTILDPNAVIQKNNEDEDNFKFQIDELDKENMTLDNFMEEMDKLSLDVCKTSQEALWSYVTDITNESKKNKMILIAAEEDEIKKQYWNMLKKKYLNDWQLLNDPKLKRKLRIIKERGTNVQMPQSKQREEIDTMQRIWSRVTVCAYNASNCNTDESLRSMSDVIAVFKRNNDTKELLYYWKAFRDGTGKQIRPIFNDYVTRMNKVAQSENFTDAGDMWRYTFEDDHFEETVNRLWSEIKPLYKLLHTYVRVKLKKHFKSELSKKEKTIPAHILGNLWAQEWQAVYNKVAIYPDIPRPTAINNKLLHAKDLFDEVDKFHQSLGFASARQAYQDIKETATSANCLPSSHDMCDGVNYKIKWCGENLTDVSVGLSRAARLLGHVQYFKHYRQLQPLYRDGPNPAFHDAISDIVAVQLTSPAHLNTLNLAQVTTGPHAELNHLLWLALEKLPLVAYAYVLDRWRWDIFANSSLKNWNQHWWDLRVNETGISPPVPRNESDLDPAAKYHVVSHVQYITYLVSHVLEFQILSSLCKKANYTGPLHNCSLRDVKEAGKLLSNGMSLGAGVDWRTVLQAITGETDLSSAGLLEYFAPLSQYLRKENEKMANLTEDMDKNPPIIIGAIIIFVILTMIIAYCVKKKDAYRKVLSWFGLTKNGSLDIVTNEMTQTKSKEDEGVNEVNV
ncbi:PREDICTED: angiotensin-converting enzyme-like [Papilio xuthus]|uniref:Angiotensin-converting enzyme n=1 Tax=Papilio xuthus TaxID=66420 RepID=A0AAJ6ZJP9_PAPXU|nr:PREDICTED: angiotensin-converting enzyme-like [Papilio xuthus]